MTLSPTDRAALERALDIVRNESAAQRQWIGERLAAGDDWEESRDLAPFTASTTRSI